jgi:micrococcal nuclease
MYEYNLKVSRVVDGDTVDGIIDCGFNILLKQRIRLAFINAPETRTRDKAEKIKGLKAKARLKEILKENKNNLVVQTQLDKKGKFGRVLGILLARYQDSQYQGRYLNVNQQLLDEGLVEVYNK